MHTLDTPTRKRLIKHLEALQLLVNFSPLAKSLAGFDNPKMEQLNADIEKLKSL